MLLRPTQDAVYQRLQDEVVLVNLRTNRIFALNRTGARFWELLQEGHDRAAIKRRLLEEFDVEPLELDREIAALSASLLEEQLVTSADG